MPEKKSPVGYERIKVIDTVHNKKEAAVVNVLSVSTIVLMILLGALLFGFERLEAMLTSNDSRVLWWFIFRTVAILFMAAIYIVMHEGIHMALMKLFRKNCAVKFSYKLVYASVGCDACFSKIEYLVICIAPLLLLGIVLTVLCVAVPAHWQWPVYIIQVLNLSSAAGDIYIFAILSRMPKDILVRDDGVTISVFGSIE